MKWEKPDLFSLTSRTVAWGLTTCFGGTDVIPHCRGGQGATNAPDAGAQCAYGNGAQEECMNGDAPRTNAGVGCSTGNNTTP